MPANPASRVAYRLDLLVRSCLVVSCTGGVSTGFLRTISAQDTEFALVSGKLLFLVLLGFGSIWE